MSKSVILESQIYIKNQESIKNEETKAVNSIDIEAKSLPAILMVKEEWDNCLSTTNIDKQCVNHRIFLCEDCFASLQEHKWCDFVFKSCSSELIGFTRKIKFAEDRLVRLYNYLQIAQPEHSLREVPLDLTNAYMQWRKLKSKFDYFLKNNNLWRIKKLCNEVIELLTKIQSGNLSFTEDILKNIDLSKKEG